MRYTNNTAAGGSAAVATGEWSMWHKPPPRRFIQAREARMRGWGFIDATCSKGINTIPGREEGIGAELGVVTVPFPLKLENGGVRLVVAGQAR
ncbi:hypothetical protein ACCO45_005297 [Purpureocillium lilacinum]|uniref:Uncharacterized protein n=1 Tax=Purpureocillium lilacinum TaxID=33203 RepID=A0ACC4DV05_PURLI